MYPTPNQHMQWQFLSYKCGNCKTRTEHLCCNYRCAERCSICHIYGPNTVILDANVAFMISIIKKENVKHVETVLKRRFAPIVVMIIVVIM